MFGSSGCHPPMGSGHGFRGARSRDPRTFAARRASCLWLYALSGKSVSNALIDWLRRRHGWEVRRDWIMMCPGVVPSLHAAVMAFAERGESGHRAAPSVFPFFSAVTNTGRQLIHNPLRLQDGRYDNRF